jgi:hypothetical protein
MGRSDKMRRTLRNSKESQLSREFQGEVIEPGVGFPSYPIIELPIDSLEAFDYENAENAKYTVEDLRGILIEEIKLYRIRRENIQSFSLNGSKVYRGSKSP